MLSGPLRGMGREAECTVSAVKVSLPGTNLYEYTKLGIHNAPADLPDGPYAVTIEGRTVLVQRRQGAWIS